jgi:hypothetical protein
VLYAALAPASPADVVSCPVLTKAFATPAFEALLEGSATWLKHAWGSTAGQHLLQEWGYDAATKLNDESD